MDLGRYEELMPSRFDTARHVLRAELIAELEKRGYPFNERTMTLERYLAQVLSGMTGRAVSESHTPVAALISEVRNLITGGKSSAATSPIETALADIASPDGVALSFADGGALQLIDGDPFSLVGT
jgi:hypothetical protein